MPKLELLHYCNQRLKMKIHFNLLSFWLIYIGTIIGAFYKYHISIMIVSILMIISGVFNLFIPQIKEQSNDRTN